MLKNKLAVPVLVAVMVWAALVVPVACDPKLSDVGDNEIAGPEEEVGFGVAVAVLCAVAVGVDLGVTVGVGVDRDVDVGVGVREPPHAEAAREAWKLRASRSEHAAKVGANFVFKATSSDCRRARRGLSLDGHPLPDGTGRSTLTTN